MSSSPADSKTLDVHAENVLSKNENQKLQKKSIALKDDSMQRIRQSIQTSLIESFALFFKNQDARKLPVSMASSRIVMETAVKFGLEAVWTTRKSRSDGSQSNNSREILEAEYRNVTIDNMIKHQESLFRFSIGHVLKHCKTELEPLVNVIAKLKDYIQNPDAFPCFTYEQVVNLVRRQKDQFLEVFPNQQIPVMGEILDPNCKQYLCKYHTKRPTFIIQMPSTMQPFHMKRNRVSFMDEMLALKTACAPVPVETVESVELLVPCIGELMDGSIREDDFKKICIAAIQQGLFTIKDESVVRKAYETLIGFDDSKNQNFDNVDTKKCALNEQDTKKCVFELLKRKFEGTFATAMHTLGVEFKPSLQTYLNLRFHNSVSSGGYELDIDRFVEIFS